MTRMAWKVVGLLALGTCAGAGGAGAQPQWFDRLMTVGEVSEAEGKALVRHAADLVWGRTPDAGALPAKVRDDRHGRLVFVSASDGRRAAHLGLGAARGFPRAIAAAAALLRHAAGAEFAARWVKLDVVHVVSTVGMAPLSAPLRVERGIHGIAFDGRSRLALLPGEIVARGLIGKGGALDTLRLTAYLKARPALAREFDRLDMARRSELYLFNTRSFFTDGAATVELFRGHRAKVAVTAESVLASARAAGAWLARSVADDGTFAHLPGPGGEDRREELNLVRHAGAVSALLELHATTKDPALLAAARRALEHLAAQARPLERGGQKCMAINDGGFVRLGANALACVALARYAQITTDRKHLRLTQGLGTWMLTTQRPDGQFPLHEQVFPNGRASRRKSVYYPSQACAALVRLHGLDGDERWLDAAEKGVRYLVTQHESRPADERPHDHWLLQALVELHRLRPDTLHVVHTRHMADAICKAQNRTPGTRDWMGSYGSPPRTIPAAIRSRALCAAHELFRRTRQAPRAARCLEALKLGAAFQMLTQFRPESVLYLDEPQRALGAFHRSLTSHRTLADYAQQNIQSLVGLHRILAGGPEP